MSSTPAGADSVSLYGRFVDIAELAKLRLTSLVVVATVVGFQLGHSGPVDRQMTLALVATIVGMGLVVGAANALNQLIERHHDARMTRTADRPLASGRVTPRQVLLPSLAITVGGLVLLGVLANLASAVAALLAFVLYVIAYTPLKRVAPLSVLVGAIPGALPPVIGWTAAAGGFEARSLILFAIMFVWQLPHFLAIAWLHRDDYANAGFRVLSVVDPTGRRITIEMIVYSLLLIPVSLLPTYFGIAGHIYYVGALVLSFAFLAFSMEVARLRSRISALQHLYASLAYLMLLFALMSLNKISA